MLLNLLRGGDMVSLLINLLVRVFIVLCCLPFHEFAHAWVADKLGDKTPRLAGRLTLNPFAHLDLWGTVMIFLVGIGYAKPVEVNVRNMRCGTKQGLALTAAAGPLSNILLALIIMLISNTAALLLGNVNPEFAELLVVWLSLAASINVTLAVFNLLPIPPLDGFNILQIFLPYKAVRFVSQYHVYIRYGLLALLLLGVLSVPISLLSNALYSGMSWLASLPFALFGAAA
ncbi:MAG: site-2 protease family protein [Oscillospiraceae bacterium]|jgi:Zn-dependent protease|nr:site-2 protease family protein [Oscillospiraceae bacterium]